MPLTLTASPTDTVGIAGSAHGVLRFSRSFSESVGVTDAQINWFVKNGTALKFHDYFINTVGITDVLITHRLSLRNPLSDSVGIVGTLGVVKIFHRPTMDEVGILGSLSFTGALIQFDTWRPVSKPDNSMILVCRTPVGEHDTYTGLTHLSLWTIGQDGSSGSPVVKTPATNGFGWVSYGHPEWSPDGSSIVVFVETLTEYKLMVIDASGFGI